VRAVAARGQCATHDLAVPAHEIQGEVVILRERLDDERATVGADQDIIADPLRLARLRPGDRLLTDSRPGYRFVSARLGDMVWIVAALAHHPGTFSRAAVEWSWHGRPGVGGVTRASWLAGQYRRQSATSRSARQAQDQGDGDGHHDSAAHEGDD
jgi:hypothetical protein